MKSSFVAMGLAAVVAVAGMVVGVIAIYRLSNMPPAGNQASAPSQIESPAADLTERATALAERELLHLNAAEMIYRNKVFVHVYLMSDTLSTPSRQYMKLYRHFTHYEILDIERTTSTLHPIKISIRFDFDLVGTRGTAASQPEDVAIVRKVQEDHAFVVHRSDTLVREYLCDAAGLAKELPPLPERPNFFWSSLTEKLGVLSLEEPMVPREGGSGGKRGP